MHLIAPYRVIKYQANIDQLSRIYPDQGVSMKRSHGSHKSTDDTRGCLSLSLWVKTRVSASDSPLVSATAYHYLVPDGVHLSPPAY